MAMVNITKKYIDILVNGVQEASYEQKDTNGDYDISVSDIQSFQWNRMVDVKLDANNSNTYSITGGYLYYHYIYDYDDPTDEPGTIEFRDSGGNVLHSVNATSDSVGREDSVTINLPNATEVYIENSDASFGFEVEVDRCTNETTLTDKGGSTHRIPTGISIDGVAQTTNN